MMNIQVDLGVILLFKNSWLRKLFKQLPIWPIGLLKQELCVKLFSSFLLKSPALYDLLFCPTLTETWFAS